MNIQQVSRNRLFCDTGSVLHFASPICLLLFAFHSGTSEQRYSRAWTRACAEPKCVDRRNMMSETVVTMDGSSNNASNNPRQVPMVKTEPGQPNPLSGIRLNVAYFKTIPGILKLTQLVSTRLIFCCLFDPSCIKIER